MIENRDCIKCDLSLGCKNVCITGIGNPNADLMIVAESPAAEDSDTRGVLTAYKDRILLKVIKDALEVDPNSLYLTTLVKCRAHDGRKAELSEAEACLGYLEEEIKAVKPKVILALGDTVMQVLTGEKSITKKRGYVLDLAVKGLDKIPVVPTFQPAYLAYNENQLKNFALDIEKAHHISIGYKREAKKTRTVWIEEVAQIHDLVDYIQRTKVCCFDFETFGLDTYSGDFYATLLSISFQPGSSYIIPLYHFESYFVEEDIEYMMAVLDAEIFQNPKIKKINHNIKFDMHVLNWFGISDIRGQISDTMLQHHLLDETVKHGLKEIVESAFPEYSGYEKETGEYKWDKVPLKILGEYGGTDTDLTLRLEQIQEDRLLQDEKLYRIYRNQTIPSLRSTFYAERDGHPIDIDFLNKSIKEVQEIIAKHNDKLKSYKQVKKFEAAERERVTEFTIKELEGKLAAATARKKRSTDTKAEVDYRDKIAKIKAGSLQVYGGLNLNAPAQLSKLLYTKDGFNFKQPYKKGKEGGTGKEILITLNDETGFIDDLQLNRSLEKNLSTYMIGIDDRIDKKNLIHTSYLLHGTVSGRPSSQNPNLQNIPNISKLKNPLAIDVVGRIKKMYIPPAGYCILQADFSQMELRIAASFANEENMLEAYRTNQDLHILTAKKINNLSDESYMKLSDYDKKELRTRAKAGNFGLLYDMSADGFKEYAKNEYGVNISLSEATKIRNAFFRAYPGLKTWHADAIQRAKQNGFVRTLFGRKRHTPDIKNPDDFKRAMDERVAINSPVQGTGAEFTLFGLALLTNRLDPVVRLGNTVHDSISYFVPIVPELISSTARIIRKTCEELPTEQYFKTKLKRVTMKIDIEHSEKSWKDLEPYF